MCMTCSYELVCQYVRVIIDMRSSFCVGAHICERACVCTPVCGSARACVYVSVNLCVR